MVAACYRGYEFFRTVGASSPIDRAGGKGDSNPMKTASITETRKRLSALLDNVRKGERILITDRGRPVARLEPVDSDECVDSTGRLARLERAGVIRRSRGKASRMILETRPQARPSE